MAVAVLSSMLRKRVFSDDLFFDDDDPLPLHKRVRSSSSSDHQIWKLTLYNNFNQFLEVVLDACRGGNLDSGVKSCNVRGSGDESIFSSEVDGDVSLPREVNVVNPLGVGPSGNSNPVNLPTDGPGWLDLIVGEMMSASDVNDARCRASKTLELLEKSIMIHAGREVSEENMKLKERVESLLSDNAILKRAVVIQHKRQKDYDVKNQELQQMNQLLMEYQEKLKTAELNNYALAMHLKQAQQNCSIIGRYHPDVF